jgi:hypothetical protein
LSPDLGTLEQIQPRTLWESEASSFTPWLAANLILLGKALGLDLELSQTEAAVGSFSCDIHARDTGRDRQVIIENQLEPTDHRHLGQLLTYAAGLDATVIVWISPEFRDEHREAIDWLNRHTSENVEFFGVALEVVRIGDSKPAVVFRLAASPNEWATTVRSTARPERSAKADAYQEFFQAVIDELREKHKFTNSRLAQPRHFYSFSSGVVSGILYTAAFPSGARLRAELYIDVGEAGRNKAVYDWLLTQKAEIESRTGPLVWERLDQKRACRISLVRLNSSIDDAALHSAEMRAWLVDALLKLKAVFGPRLLSAVQAVTQKNRSDGDTSELSSPNE